MIAFSLQTPRHRGNALAWAETIYIGPEVDCLGSKENQRLNP